MGPMANIVFSLHPPGRYLPWSWMSACRVALIAPKRSVCETRGFPLLAQPTLAVPVNVMTETVAAGANTRT